MRIHFHFHRHNRHNHHNHEGGVSSPTEDVRPVSEVEAGVNFRSASGARRLLCTLQQAPVDPAVVSLGRGLGIRQSMGLEKVCGTARSGIWVLNCDCRVVCCPPIATTYLCVRWMKRKAYHTAGVTPPHECLLQWSDHKPITASGME